MKIGIKCGHDNWKYVFDHVRPACAELWWRLDWDDRYGDIYHKLHELHIPFGMHFWAITSGGFEPNIAYAPDGVAEESAELVRRSIDIAAREGATYLNIHPGSYALRKLDLDNKVMTVLDCHILSPDELVATLSFQTKKLDAYAKSKGVMLLVETVPANEPAHWRDDAGRDDVQKGYGISPDVLIELARDGRYITNDFGHTIASWVSEDRDFLAKKLEDVTIALASQTKLIHLNTVRPPFNGTDSHDGVTSEDFSRNVLPDKEQTIRLLALFKDRSDVWIVPEPQADRMVENYEEIARLVK